MKGESRRLIRVAAALMEECGTERGASECGRVGLN